ncbi:class II histone deacetylase complex subunits 2 and 3-domain-containing protein [Morchella snyderi]|nr:class II histone deacetylase complex subunits 2 and 3-domain-containing protein [Morchella snyderi]
MQLPFRAPYLGPAEYAIGLPLRTKTVTPKAIDQKTAYLTLIIEKHEEIRKYLSNPYGADADLVKTMEKIVENTGKVATHPDLLMKKIEVSDAVAGKEADYHAAMSSKFVFLRAFLVAVKQQHLKIVIVAERGPLIDTLEIFLRGIRIAYTRLDQFSTLPKIPHDDNEGLVRVFLLPSSKSGAVVVSNVADCLIAMDSSFDASLQDIQKCRRNSYEVNKLAPVFRLVAINTIEHLRLCSPPGQEIPLYVYIETLKNLRQQVGIASQDYGSAISRAPTKITKWLQKKAEGKLEIPEIPELPLFEITSHTQPTPNTSTNSSGNEGSDKRKRQETQTVISPQQESKRTRVNDPEPMDPVPEFAESPSSHVAGVVTHVSDSMTSQTSIVPHPLSLLMQIDDESYLTVTESVAMDISEGDQTAMEQDNRTEYVSREQLVAAFRGQAENLQQWMESTGRLQIRHEELKKKLIEARKELKKSQKTQRDAENRKEHMSKELTKARNERNKADEELKEAHARLLAGPPEVAALEQSRAENERLNEKLRSVESKLQARDNEFDFLREQYQGASNGALELKVDNTRLQEENSVLERRGADVVVKLRRMQHDNQIQARDKQIESLTLQLKEREERIARLEHERQVNTRTRGSIGMRASSVSIRGSPIQSRATSPATGLGTYGRESSSTHPLRNG